MIATSRVSALMHVTITSTARNTARYVERCIRSAREQTHQNFTHYYVDAGSEDSTVVLAQSAASNDDRVRVSRGVTSSNSLDNLLSIWRELPPDEIIAWLDGDDAFLIDKALEFVVEAHQKGAWVTWGQFLTSNGEVGFASDVGPAPRREPWRATHLKTFRAGLAQRIDPEHLKDGYAWDQAVMIPCLEMAAERVQFISRAIYLYNVDNSFARNAPAEEQQRELAAVKRIRSYPRYRRLEKL